MARCTRCGFARYCSKGCQKAHWRYHKSTCEELANDSWNYFQYKQGYDVYYGPVDKYTFELTRHRAKYARKMRFMYPEADLSKPHKLVSHSMD